MQRTSWLERIGRSRLLVLVLVAFCARVVTFGNPIVFVDEEFYYVVARAIAHGALPFVDVWDRKPIGLFLIYLPAGLFAPPAGVLVYQATAFAAVVATGLLIARFADRLGWSRGALIAATLYVLWIDLADGQGGQSPVFYNLLMIAAAVCFVDSSRAVSDTSRRRLGAATMALVGLALQIKYSVLFEGLCFGLWLLWGEWRARNSPLSLVAYAAALCAIAIVPTAAVFAGYALAGHGEPYLYANFLSIFARRPDPWAESLENINTSAQILVPVLLLALAGLTVRAPDSAAKRFLATWLAASVFGFVIFGSWFNHYTLPVLVPATCCMAGLLGDRPLGRKVAIPLAVLVFLVGQGVLQSERHRRGTPAEFARIAGIVGRGPGALYVYSGTTMLYAASGRPSLTRYLFPTHLMLRREQGAIGVDQASEVRHILDQRPEIVTMQTIEPGERPEIRAIVTERLARDGYRRIGHAPFGTTFIDIYRRPA